MLDSNDYLLTNHLALSPKQQFSHKLVGAKFIVNPDNKITKIANKSFLTKINFPIIIENEQYILTDWLKDKLFKFRTDSLIAATLTRDILFDNETIPLAISLTKKETGGKDYDIIIELQPLYQEKLWQVQQNKYSTLFYHSFKNNTLPMLIVDKELHVLAASDSYKKLIRFTTENTLQEIDITKNLSNASKEKLLLCHSKRLLDPSAVPNKYSIDLVDSNGIKHACFILVEIITPQLDSVISILGPTAITSPTLEDIPESVDLHIPFYQSPIITFITSLEGRLLDANQSFFILTGMHKNKLQAQKVFWFDLTSGFLNDQHQEIIHKLKVNSSVENLKITFNFPALSPKERNTLLSARLIQFNDAPAIIFTLIDVSAIPHLPTDLFHMEELKVASELAAGVGHEVRNPMTAVRGFLQMLSQKPDLTKYQSYFDLMLEELDRANQIITEYLSLAKTKTNKFTTENINTIIEQLFPLLQITALNANKKIFLNLSSVNDLYLDSKEIRQLILNIVKNGLESMENGKDLTIKTYQTNLNSIMLEIKDEGSGIPANILDKIGSPFFTTKANGTGLGLSICYTIAEKNNAKIRLESSPTGTTFFIEFAKL